MKLTAEKQAEKAEKQAEIKAENQAKKLRCLRILKLTAEKLRNPLRSWDLDRKCWNALAEIEFFLKANKQLKTKRLRNAENFIASTQVTIDDEFLVGYLDMQVSGTRQYIQIKYLVCLKCKCYLVKRHCRHILKVQKKAAPGGLLKNKIAAGPFLTTPHRTCD